MKVVIVGGGFGGVRAALGLANKTGVEVTLISSQPYFQYFPALYRTATGRSPFEAMVPLSDFFEYAKNITVLEDIIVDIDAKGKAAVSAAGSHYKYDALVLALGNVTAFFGIKGLEDYAYGVKNIEEAYKLKRHLHDQLMHDESAERNYVVVGAGASGVELSAELTYYLKKIRKKHKIDSKFTIDLIEAAPRPLGAMPENFSAQVDKRLKKLGIKTYYNTAVKAEKIDEIELPRGPISSHTVIWTAGLTNNPFFAKFKNLFEFGKAGRVVVDEHLQAAPDIYIIGDSAVTEFSGMAQTAMHNASFVVDCILRTAHGRKLRKYHPKRPVYAIPVGPYWTAVLWGKVQILGFPGWVLRRLADLRLYLTFLPLSKAFITWRYGFVDEEACPICKQ